MNTTDVSPAKYHFDRAKPFYPLVMSYLMQLHGLKELAALGSLGAMRTWDIQHLGEPSPENEALQLNAAKLLGPLELLITGDGNRLTVPVEAVAEEFFHNHKHLLKYQVQAALSVLVMAHEIAKHQPYRTDNELWEFLRHCRNAAAHNGRWNLINGEPRRPASWRGITLNASLNSCPLRIGEDGIGTLRVGDPVALLWDIEIATPAMQP